MSQADRMRRYYADNRERILREHKERYASDPEFRERKKALARSYAQKLREEFLAAYGGRCECCEEDEPRFLVLDHRSGDGYADRMMTGGRNQGVLRRLRKEGWPERYRLLCANCNTATSHGRVCPHKERG